MYGCALSCSQIVYKGIRPYSLNTTTAYVLWSGRSGDVTMILQAAIEITCHAHSTTVWVGRCYILLRYLVFVFVVRFLFIR